LKSVVVTFDRHPATVVRPDTAPLLLTDLDQKLELLADCGIDLTLVLPFDRRRSDESAEDFVSDVLVDGLGARLVVVGADFHFGHGRKGDVSLLTELGRGKGFEVVGVGLAQLDGSEPISSTHIRQLLAEGEVREAARLLGRSHQVRGTVVRGDGRGAEMLGFPTANLSVPPEIALPADGVYAGRYARPGSSNPPGGFRAAISLGRPPTFYDNTEPGSARVLEAHLIDFEGDLYGEQAHVSFDRLLHPQKRFDEVEQLIAQMETDVQDARVPLGSD